MSATSALLRDALLRAVARISGPDWRRRLDALNADAIQAFGAAALLDADAEAVFQAVQARRDRMAAAAGRHRATRRAGEGSGCVTPLGAFAFDRLAGLRPAEPPARPAPREDAAPRDSPPRPTREEGRAGTRRRYYAGHRLPWPATIKQDFHPAELGAIAVIAREIDRNETCELPLGTIAARAKCCRRTVQTAIRWAAQRGYLAIEERAKGTHVIRIASDAIREWTGRVRRSEGKARKIEEKEDLDVPDKVATGCLPPGDPGPGRRSTGASQAVRSTAPPLPEPMPEPIPDRSSGERAHPPTPSRLDEAIAAWRCKILHGPAAESSVMGAAAWSGPCPVPRPG